MWSGNFWYYSCCYIFKYNVFVVLICVFTLPYISVWPGCLWRLIHSNDSQKCLPYWFGVTVRFWRCDWLVRFELSSDGTVSGEQLFLIEFGRVIQVCDFDFWTKCFWDCFFLANRITSVDDWFMDVRFMYFSTVVWYNSFFVSALCRVYEWCVFCVALLLCAGGGLWFFASVFILF